MDTIKSNEEISRIFASGQRLSNKYATFIFVPKSAVGRHLQEHDPCGRVAFIAGKKLGGAVWRNSAKRRMREIYRTCKKQAIDYDLLFIARSGIVSESYSKVFNACEKTLNKLGDEKN